jgi:hypothetical protein
MPSQVADDLWHEFILFTKNYDAFCRQAFGGFFHHSPAAVLSPEQKAKQREYQRAYKARKKQEEEDWKLVQELATQGTTNVSA